MELLIFLIQVVVISLSGVMAPGPITATTIATGARSRWAGPLIAVGHGIVEFPLMIVIVLGMDKIFKLTHTRIIIGLAGGAFLLLMAFQMLAGARAAQDPAAKPAKRTPLLAGVVLSAGNPYFLLWWATVGLTLATTAKGLGIWAFALFAIVHWLCDLIWLEALSWASFKGSTLLGPRCQQIVLLVCSAALFSFGVYFIYNATGSLAPLVAPGVRQIVTWACAVGLCGLGLFFVYKTITAVSTLFGPRIARLALLVCASGLSVLAIALIFRAVLT